MNPSLTEILFDFISLFFPVYCHACGESLVKGESTICSTCKLELPFTDHYADVENALWKRLHYRVPITYAMALFKFNKSGRVQKLMHALKYRNHPEIGIVLGKLLAEKLKVITAEDPVQLIIPIPLFSTKKRSRGYNQSAMLAEGISLKLGVPFSDDVIERLVNTQTQTRKTRLKRWENVETVFTMKDLEIVKGKHILLVDDVITTGATVEACANVLLTTGCRKLSIACIAEA